MARKKAAPAAAPDSGALVAAANILIAGQHYDAGAEVTDAPEGEVIKMVRMRRVITAEEFAARTDLPQSAPEPEGDAGDAGEPEADSDSDGETGAA
ncbi:MAG: hypothetical protein AB7G24_00810 [Novosphingobium sp.]